MIIRNWKNAKYIDDGVAIRTVRKEYHDGTLALTLVDAETGEPWATVSSNLGEAISPLLGPDEICVKTYSENEGIMEDLILAGALSVPRAAAHNGFEEFPICEVLV